MKLQNLIVIFIIIIIPVILLVSLYISNGLKTIEYQAMYDTGLLNATHDAIYAFEQNTGNNELSDNPEIKRDILKSSIKMFERSLCNNCGISAYNTEEIEEYIPAIVFGMYDGFYMYAPSAVYNNETNKYEYTHNLKNYVYYSETLTGIGNNNSDVVIRYSLDNYVVVSGDFGDGYEIKSGYLITTVSEKMWYYVDNNDEKAYEYILKGRDFTSWFNLNVAQGDIDSLYYIKSTNDPEDENSLYVQHKREIIKKKIEGVLNSTITAYSEKNWGYNYKMPKLSEQDWEKIYSNISMLTFFQGKSIGLTKYNGYCVLNSTNSREYVNSELMYFTDGNGYYHDIRCSKCLEEGVTLNGYKIGEFEKRKVEKEVTVTNDDGTQTTTSISEYGYDHSELACYECINGQINNEKAIRDNKLLSVKEYVDSLGNTEEEKRLKTAYYTSLARERYNQVHI